MTDRELDALIADKLFGWSDFWTDGTTLMAYPPEDETERWPIPFYSTDPAACALVLDEIERRGWAWRWEWEPITKELGFAISIPGKWGVKPPSVNYSAVVAGDMSRYRPVCLAALRALGVEVE